MKIILFLILSINQGWGGTKFVDSQSACQKSLKKGSTIVHIADSSCILKIICSLTDSITPRIFFSCKDDKNYYSDFGRKKTSVLYRDKTIFYTTISDELNESGKYTSQVVFSSTLKGKDEILKSSDEGYYHFFKEKEDVNLYLLYPAKCSIKTFKVNGFNECFIKKEKVSLIK